MYVLDGLKLLYQLYFAYLPTHVTGCRRPRYSTGLFTKWLKL